jgi:hypothetical protein
VGWIINVHCQRCLQELVKKNALTIFKKADDAYRAGTINM